MDDTEQKTFTISKQTGISIGLVLAVVVLVVPGVWSLRGWVDGRQQAEQVTKVEIAGLSTMLEELREDVVALRTSFTAFRAEAKQAEIEAAREREIATASRYRASDHAKFWEVLLEYNPWLRKIIVVPDVTNGLRPIYSEEYDPEAVIPWMETQE